MKRFIFLILLTTQMILAQDAEGPFRSLARAVLPYPFHLIQELRTDIAAMGPPGADINAQRARVDSILVFALDLTAGDRAAALFLCAFSSVPFRDITLVTPLLHLSLPLSLSAESDEEFRHRLVALPKRLFEDSPKSGDADKVAHVFGSAWIAWVSRSGFVADMAGHLVEILENLFKLQGGSDPRDIRANSVGVSVARGLTQYPAVPPSRFFRQSLGKDRPNAPSDTDRR